MSNHSATLESVLDWRTEKDVRRLPNAILGMILFVAAEIMFFAALISAYTITRASALGGVWPPPEQPLLPAERTAFNTALLLFSGVLLWWGNRSLRSAPVMAWRFLASSLALGIAFVSLQGVEWVALLRQGLTVRSSTEGSFFYLIVGAHALHAVAAIVAMAWVYWRVRRGALSPQVFTAARIFWYFVVLLWPLIYWRVYL
jgi:heme/copper-type cytochrome/quinol oxidase subunit 3